MLHDNNGFGINSKKYSNYNDKNENFIDQKHLMNYNKRGCSIDSKQDNKVNYNSVNFSKTPTADIKNIITQVERPNRTNNTKASGYR